jgi:hypothetical protein
MRNHNVLSADRMKRLGALIPALFVVLTLVACGGSGAPNTPTSGAKNRAFISNTFTGSLQIVDTQNDTTPLTAQTTNNQGQLIPGQPVTIPVSNTATFEVESPDHTVTAVYDPTSIAIWFVTNSSETTAGDVPLTSSTSMILLSPDSATIYAPEPNLDIPTKHPGGVEVVTRSSATITATYQVPSASKIALSPSGQYLLVFADNSDSVFLINLTATTVTPVEITGFARPVNAFFSSDNNTAWVINCGPECGSGNPASVAALDIPSQKITSTVPVGGASVGFLNGTTLYVAGSPVPPGTTSTYDAVNVGNMTRITTNSVAIGANSCSNTVTGCLSVVDIGSNTADAALPPRGAITALMSVSGRNVIYAIEGGFLNIYNSETDQLQGTQITFSGALFDIVQVDQ